MAGRGIFGVVLYGICTVFHYEELKGVKNPKKSCYVIYGSFLKYQNNLFKIQGNLLLLNFNQNSSKNYAKFLAKFKKLEPRKMPEIVKL